MFYKIVQTKDRGRAVIATQNIVPGPMGFEVFREEALIIMPLRNSKTDLSGPLPAILSKFDPQMWTDWWAYLQQTEEVKQKTLALYRDMECPHAICLRNYLIEKQQHKEEEKVCEDDYDSGILDRQDEFVNFAMVMRYNAVELQPPTADGTGPGIDHGSGLFDTACRMNHSCTPNCAWYTSVDGRQKIIRAIAPIQENEELTLNYMNNELEPIVQRRDDLQKSKGFICDCPRCSTAKGDDTRRFPCVTGKCTGVHFLDQPLADTDPKLLQCTSCGAQASNEYLQDMLQLEIQVEREINALEKMPKQQRNEEASERVMKLEPPHRLHALAEKCFLLKAELQTHQGRFTSAAEFYAKQLECRDAILSPHGESMTTAFTYELLGDTLANVSLEKAEQAYQKTVRTLQFMRGGKTDPYSKCAINKLLDVQTMRVSQDGDGNEGDDTAKKGDCVANLQGLSLFTNDDSCALCGNPSMLVCYCCQVRYCSEDHVQLHWPQVHKQVCSGCRSTAAAGDKDKAIVSSVLTGSIHTVHT